MSNPLNEPAVLALPARPSIPPIPARSVAMRLVASRGAAGRLHARADAPAPADPTQPDADWSSCLDSAIGPLVLRPLRPADAPAHAAFLAALGEAGRQRRAFALPSVPPAASARLWRLVLAPGEGAAEGQSAADGQMAAGGAPLLGELQLCIGPNRVAAEFMLAVRPESQGRGLGRLLIGGLLDACRQQRVDLVCASVPAGSAPMLALARACGFQVLRAADGTAQLALMLRPRGVR